MPQESTIEDVIRMARRLSALDKLKLIETLAPDLEAALKSQTDQATDNSAAADEQYQRGYEQIPEETTDLEAILPILPLPTERWE